MNNQNNDETAAGLAVWRTIFMASVFTLAALGVVLVYSASCVRAAAGGIDSIFLQRQLLWLVLGVGGYAVASRIDWARRGRWIGALFLLTLLLLAAVRIPGVGAKVNGAYRWLRLGGFNMQPSELAKFAAVLALSAFLSRFPAKLPFWRGFLPAGLMVGVVGGLVVIEPDVGTAALIGAVAGSMLVVGGARWWQIALIFGGAASGAAWFGVHKFDYILKRVEAWQTNSIEGAGYQIHMSKVALGSGGVTGMGLGEGPAKLFYLPEAHTDFIFAIAGQELGLVGCLTIVGAFGALVVAGIKLLGRARDKFSGLLIYGAVMMLGLQAAFNLAVVTASIPPKGISLPFVSFGGSGLFIALTTAGAVLSVSRPPRRAKMPDAVLVYVCGGARQATIHN
ncbi:putative lipid II flippase FtsW [Planctomycetales bacterium]|nr:putative lipid II flippase FtsW [Planctomycetales bacterium]GHT04057.1 putative lipid II flippase FtsW [Planctomycetales bacterium]GHV22755.1 putative lipid II flippase FtsW [Planctomycetales bacterium]